jgi:hypothetical protein
MSATPILDLTEAPPKRPATRWIGVVVGLFIGVLLGLLPIIFPRQFGGFNVFLIFPAMYVTIAVHELGHLLFGAMVGMAPGAIVIGGLVIHKSGQRWLMRFDYRRLFGGGLAMVLPPNGDFRPGAYGWMVAGGPITSLFFVVLCRLVVLWQGHGMRGWNVTVYWVALLVVVGPLVPASSGINKSDGARLWELLRRPDQCRAWMAVRALQTEETRGVLPRDWDKKFVQQMLMASPSAREYPYIQMLPTGAAWMKRTNNRGCSIWRMLWRNPLVAEKCFAK